MAREHNAIIYATQLSKAAAQASGGAYSDTGISRLGETLTPVLDLWSRPDWAFLRQEILWGVFPSNIAIAGEFSSVGVSSPTNSQLIVTVEGFYFQAGAPQRFNVMVGSNIAFDATSNPTSRDTRKLSLGGAPGTQTISFAHGQAASNGTRVGQIRLGTNAEGAWYPFEVVLAPGTFVALETDAILTAISATIIGRERQAFPGELRG